MCVCAHMYSQCVCVYRPCIYLCVNIGESVCAYVYRRGVCVCVCTGCV